MIICPVCEHQQQSGAECDGCGKVFVASPVFEVRSDPVPGLEGTPLGAPGVPVAVNALNDLEVNTLRSGPDLPPQQVPELERARQEVGAVAVQPMNELDRARAEDDGVRTQVPTGAVTCRYCRHVQAEGLLCERCGMRLPRAAVTGTPTAAKPAETIWTRCRSCGAPAKAGMRCGDCGKPVPLPDV
ncbi:MAG: hypothetical protein ACOZIN_03400 [Myxococcota bacterium]